MTAVRVPLGNHSCEDEAKGQQHLQKQNGDVAILRPVNASLTASAAKMVTHANGQHGGRGGGCVCVFVCVSVGGCGCVGGVVTLKFF